MSKPFRIFNGQAYIRVAIENANSSAPPRGHALVGLGIFNAYIFVPAGHLRKIRMHNVLLFLPKLFAFLLSFSITDDAHTVNGGAYPDRCASLIISCGN